MPTADIISILLTTFCALHLCQSFTLTPSSLHYVASSPTKLFETTTQTKQDVSMEQWNKGQGIVCPNIEIRTTAKSVGGRGLFWKQSKDHAKQGDILAYIPHALVFEMSNLRKTFPELDELHNEVTDDEGSKSSSSSPSWPSIFTTYACEALLENKRNEHVWKTWIELWSGGGPDGPRPSTSYTEEEISLLMKMINGDDYDSSIEATIREMIDKRHRTFVRDLDSVRNCTTSNEETFARLYSIILSRSANLGPQWQNRRGVIPLHDMINHPPSDGSKSKNVELFCVGDVRNMAGDEMFKNLFSSLLQSSDVLGNDSNGSGGSENNSLESYSDKDILIVADGNINYDDELLLSYRDCSKKVEIEHQIWLLLQYGFNFWRYLNFITQKQWGVKFWFQLASV